MLIINENHCANTKAEKVLMSLSLRCSWISNRDKLGWGSAWFGHLPWRPEIYCLKQTWFYPVVVLGAEWGLRIYNQDFGFLHWLLLVCFWEQSYLLYILAKIVFWFIECTLPFFPWIFDRSRYSWFQKPEFIMLLKPFKHLFTSAIYRILHLR